jgi:hypothetical protein
MTDMSSSGEGFVHSVTFNVDGTAVFVQDHTMDKLLLMLHKVTNAAGRGGKRFYLPLCLLFVEE